MSTLAPPPVEQRLVLSGIAWSTYEMLLNRFEGRHLRITYDRGDIEIMTVSPKHERAKKLLARLFDALTEELNMPVLSLGNTTFRREELEQGLEPDDCWYIEHEQLMRNVEEIDLTVHPPPDLAIEIEISRSLMNRMSIYAQLHVPEIWRYDGQTLRFCILGTDGQYAETEHSRRFPNLSTAEVTRFLDRRTRMDETRLVREFRAWVRANLAG